MENQQALSEGEVRSFVAEGRLRLTNLNNAIRALDDWADSFLVRGGADVFGGDAALMAGINDKIQQAVELADRAVVARLRTDV